MNLIRFCVQRKVTVLMVTLAVSIFGLISLFRLDQEFMPELSFPQLIILTHYPNASSQEVENLITKIIEEAASTVKNVHRIHSSSREGISIVTVEFLWGTDMDIASLNLREKVDLSKAKLPLDAGEPRIEKFNPFALPVITLSLSGPLSEKDLLALARRPVAELLEKTRGVAAVSITGGLEREILIELDRSKLTARQIPILDVAQSVKRSNITYPAGSVKDQKFEYVVRVMGSFKSVDDFRQVAVSLDRSKISSGLSSREAQRRKQQNQVTRSIPQVITLDSIANLKDTVSEVKSYSRHNGSSNISLSVIKQAESNVVRVAEEIKRKVPEIQTKLPKGLSLEVIYDQSTFVRSGIRGLIRDGLIGALLAFLVLFLFLGNWRDALVVSVSIPVSILATFFMMDAKDAMTINTITLAGLAIGVGMVVDSAIVVQENIVRHRDMKKNIEDAAVEGGREVFTAVTSSILTTVAVFFPLIFVVGVIGQIFRDLSWSVIFSQFSSLAVAFTVVPLLTKEFSHSKNRPIKFFEKISERASKWIDHYDRLLSYALDKPLRVVGWSAGACFLSILILFFLPRSLFPPMESDQIILRLEMPMGTTLEVTNQITEKVEKFLEGTKEIKSRSVTVGSIPQEGLQPLGSHQSQVVVTMKQSQKISSSKWIASLKEDLKNLNLEGGQLFFFEQGGTFSFLSGQSDPVMIEVKGHDLKNLETVSNKILDRLKGVRGLYNLRTSLSQRAPEIQLEVKRDAMSNLSLSVTDLTESILTALRGKIVSKFHEEGKEINVRLQLRPEDRKDIDAVEKLYIHTPLDLEVPIGSVVDIKRGFGPSEILRYDQQRTVIVSAHIRNRSINRVAKEIENILQDFKKEEGISLTLTGESASVSESVRSIKIVLILSILFVFMIMASQFESLWQPFLILVTIPLSLIGIAIALLISWQPLNAISGMGLVLLGGIVVNNGIILVDFVNQSRRMGVPLKSALRKSCHSRLRPILMTALTTILGMIPLACGIGKGAEMQSPMAVVVVSGLFVSTLLTLLVLPALFVIVEEKILNRQQK